jgi:hypothetical protein
MPRSVYRLLLLAPALVLALVAGHRLLSGLANDAAFPVPVYMAANVRLPPAAYQHAYDALGQASPRDGEALIARAEAGAQAGDADETVTRIVAQGLSQVPSSAAGWTLLAELRARGAEDAGGALTTAFQFAPYDYWLAGRRAELGAALWPRLSPETQERVMRQTRMLWSEPGLRRHIRPLLRAAGGRALVTRAFAQSPGDLRELNRWVAREQLRDARRLATRP